MASENVARPSDAAAKGPPRGETTAATGWRRWVPWLLIVLAALIALLAALNVWVKRQALSTNNFTDASSQLLERPFGARIAAEEHVDRVPAQTE